MTVRKGDRQIERAAAKKSARLAACQAGRKGQTGRKGDRQEGDRQAGRVADRKGGRKEWGRQAGREAGRKGANR